MMATQTQSQPRASSAARAPTSTGEGWLVYAGVLVLVGAVLNIVWGIAAIGNAHFFIANAQYVISDLNTWGWITLIIGGVLLVAALGIFGGAKWAVWTGIVFLGLNAIDQLLSISAYPFWSLAMFGLSLLAIYGLVAHGDESSDRV
jgi:hypothetical protein